MIIATAEKLHPSRTSRAVQTARACPHCKSEFQSEGFRERICPMWKGSAIWGAALPARGNGTGQR